MTTLSVVAALALFLILAAILAQPSSRSSGKLLAADLDSRELSPDCARSSQQILGRVFSDEDLRFVEGLGSVELTTALRVERKRLAVRWIYGTADEAKEIVRKHLEMASKAQDLRVTGELRLGLRYLELRLLCGCLAVLVECFGPAKLRGMAARAEDSIASLRAFSRFVETST